jgi:hypothetical protein
LDVEKALQIQAMCDEQGLAGESSIFDPSDANDSLVWDWNFSHE